MGLFFHSVENIFPYRGKIAKLFSMLWKTLRKRRADKSKGLWVLHVRITYWIELTRGERV